MAKQSERTKDKTIFMGELENCRVIEIGIANFAECVQQGTVSCSHALSLGYRFLCMHPRVNDIIENTKRAQQAVKI